MKKRYNKIGQIFDGALSSPHSASARESSRTTSPLLKICSVFTAGFIAIFPAISTGVSAYAYEKSETVYVKLDNSGTEKSVKITEQLKNDEKSEVILDKTALSKLENLSGDESYTENSDGTISWNAGGSDIFYSGEGEVSVPLKVSVSYKLNGKTKNLEEMLGASGDAEIDFHFENTATQTVYVNGAYETLYTPFVVALSTILDGDENSAIEVENGKAVSNGDSEVIAAVAAPGLSESLELDDVNLDDIKIAFTTTNFELPDVYMVATPKLLDSADLDVFDELDDLYSSMDELGEASSALASGADQIDAGTEQVKSGISGASDKLLSFKTALSEDSLSNMTAPLVAGISEKLESSKESVEESAAETASTAAATAASDAISANQATIVANLCAGWKTDKLITDLTNAFAAYQDGDQGLALYNVKTSYGLSDEEFTNLQTTALTNSAALAGVIQTVAAAHPCSESEISNYQSTASYQYTMGVLQQTTSSVATGVASEVASSTATSVLDGVKSELSSEETQATITAGILDTIAGLGVSDATFDELSSALDGINTYTDGVSELTAGVKKLDSDGIQKLVSVVNGDLKSLSARAEALTELSKDYQPIAGADSSASSTSTKFIMMIDSAEKE